MTHARVRTLLGVGLGPGDPELVTLRALRVLRAAEAILVPATERRADGPGRAEEIVLALAPELAPRLLRVPFSMSRALGERQDSRDEAATAAEGAFAAGARTVVLATIGDPSVYSTVTYVAGRVAERMADVVVEFVPGITAMQGIAAAAGEPLVTGEEVLALVPATAGRDRIDEVLRVADTVVVYKGGRRVQEIVAQVRAAGRRVTVATDVTLPAQRLHRGDALDALERVGYFSTVLAVPAERGADW